jgi:3-methyladenine DNA glycosylase AlkC
MQQTIPHHILNRKGPRNRALVDPEALTLLEEGVIETKNLMEYLTISHLKLMGNVLRDYLNSSLVERLLHDFRNTPIKPASRNAFIGKWLVSNFGTEAPHLALALSQHTSDIVRGWACFMIGHLPEVTLQERFALIRPLAADSHYGPREEAWFAIRHHIVANPVDSIALLTPWVLDTNSNIRRFATEATRPRGVWCAHIPELRRQPSLALPLLQPLADEPVKYVQKSVGNWLNDAAKDNPSWVVELTSQWLARHPESKHTAWMVAHAKRSLR